MTFYEFLTPSKCRTNANRYRQKVTFDTLPCQLSGTYEDYQGIIDVTRWIKQLFSSLFGKIWRLFATSYGTKHEGFDKTSRNWRKWRVSATFSDFLAQLAQKVVSGFDDRLAYNTPWGVALLNRLPVTIFDCLRTTLKVMKSSAFYLRKVTKSAEKWRKRHKTVTFSKLRQKCINLA